MLVSSTGERIPVEKVRELALELDGDVAGAFAAQQARMRRIETLKAEVECTKIEKKVPFKGASQVHIPLTMEILHTAFVLTRRVVLGNAPMVGVVPPSRMENNVRITISRDLSRFLHEALVRGGIAHALDAASWSAAIGGTGIIRVSWQTVERPVAAKHQQIRRAFNGAVMEYVPRRDFFLFPAHARTVDEAKGVGHQFWLRLSELQRRAKAGEYDKDAVAQLSGTDAQDMRPPVTINQASQLRIETQNLSCAEDRPIRLVELIVRWSPGASESFSDWLVTYCPENNSILRLDRYPYEHGRRCYVPIYWLRDPDNFDGISLAWLLRGLNEEMDAQHRQYIDANTLNIQQSWGVTTPMFAQLKHKKMAPGQLLPMDIPGSAQRLFEIVPLPNLGETKMLREEAERLVGISPTLMGVPLAGRRTATEVSQYVESGNAKIDDIVRTIHGADSPYAADGLREIADQVRFLYHQFFDTWIGDPEAPVWNLEHRDILTAPAEIVGSGQSLSMLPENQQPMLMMMWQLFGNDPFLISNPVLRVRLARKLAETSNVGTDWLPTEDEVKAGMQASAGQAQLVQPGLGGVVPEAGIVPNANAQEGTPGVPDILAALVNGTRQF